MAAAVAGEEDRSSNTEGSRLFKHCRGSYSLTKNEKEKNFISVLLYHKLVLWIVQTDGLKKKTAEGVESKLTCAKTV